MLTHEGVTLSLQEWAKKKNLNPETLRSRLDHQGWDIARALSTRSQEKFARRGADPVAAPRACPKMLRHKAKNQAYSRWMSGGEDYTRYFGPWGSEEAVEEYQRFAIEWAAGQMSHTRQAMGKVHVGELTAEYMEYVCRYYVKDGRPTSEQHAQRSALRILNSLYETLPVDEFKPRHLKACQQAMVAKNWARTTINQNTWRLTRCFSWGVAEELVAASVADALAHVPNLQAGRTAAVDMEPVMSISPETIAKTLPHLHPMEAHRAVVEAMIRFQGLTGCRPGELCAMTVTAVEKTDDVWVYRVKDKNTHRQTKRKPRVVWIGPRAQEILRPFLAEPGPGGRLWCFPPRWPKSAKAKRVPVSTNRYSELVRSACKAAGVEPWTPHVLRHNRATEVQRIYESDDAAAAAIGDTPDVTKAVYADPSEAVAKRIALATG
jgi:integrase